MKDLLDRLSDRVEVTNFNPREKFSHETVNFLDATVKVDGEAVFNMRAPGNGANVLFEPLESGDMRVDKFNEVLMQVNDEDYLPSANRVMTAFAEAKADGRL